MDGEGGALPGGALDCYGTIMHLGNVFYNRQPQTRPAEIAAASLIHHVESLEDSAEVFALYPAAAVRNGNGYLMRALFDVDSDTAIRFTVFDCVAHEINNSLFEEG